MDATPDLAPLVAGPVRWPGDAVEIDLGDEVVRVEAEAPDLLRAVLGDCDGRTTVRVLDERHGAAAAELIGLLLRRGAVVDGQHAWRVLHRQSSVGTALGLALDPEGIRALQRRRHLPVATGEAPVRLTPTAGSLSGLLGARRSAWPGEPAAEVDFTGLSTVLAAAYGYTFADGDPHPSRGTVASAGGLYPLLLHVLVPEPLGPLVPGVWWHDPAALSLHRVAPVPAEVGALVVEGEPGSALITNREPTVFISADLERPARKYGPRAYRYALIEAGAALQAASLAAAESGIPLRALGGVDDRGVHACLGLPEHAVALLAVSLGA